MQAMIHDPRGPWRLLTRREREVMAWVCEGKCSWAAGQILGCVEQTVKKHLHHIYQKLDVENRVTAANLLRAQS